MALVLADRVQETCTSPGTGAVTLLGAATGYQTFSTGVGNGNTCYYCIADQGGANWEVGIGTYASSGNTLTRTTPLSGSAATPVNFSSGTQNVFVTYPAEKSVNLDASGNVSALGTVSSGTWQGSTVGVSYGGTGVTTSTGSGSNVLSTSPVLTTPNLGTPSAVTLTSATGLPLTTGVTGILPTANGGTNLSAFNANGAVYATSSSALTTGTLPLTGGGTGATTAQTAMNTLAGAVTSGSYLRGNGTNVVLSTIQASDVPTLNQNTTGSSGSCTGNAATATTATNVSGTVGIANGGTGLTSVGASGTVLTSNGSSASWAAAAGAANVQTFSSSGTWTKPSGATFVVVELWGGGAGGSSGGRSAASTNTYGGYGGGGGAYMRKQYNASDLAATETVVIGAGGAGGAAVTTDSTVGAYGYPGGRSTFSTSLVAYGGNFQYGGGGFSSSQPVTTSASSSQGAAFGGNTVFTSDGVPSGWGGGGGGPASVGINYAGGASLLGGSGGGSGGGKTSANVGYSGKSGGSYLYNAGGVGGGGIGGALGTAGAAGSNAGDGGGGGGSGYASSFILGQSGISAFGNGTYVTTAYGNSAYTSTDGVTWTRRNTPAQVSFVAYTGSVFVVVVSPSGSSYQVYTTTDFVTYTFKSDPSTGSSTFSFTNGYLFISFGQSGQFAYSSDFINWTFSSINISNQAYYFVWTGSYYVVSMGISPYLKYSSNLTTWTNCTVSGIGYAGKFATNGSTITGVCTDSSTSRYSTDGGITWLSAAAASLSYATGMWYANGYFWIANQGGATQYYSTNASNWTSVTLSQAQGLYYNGGTYVAIAYVEPGTTIAYTASSPAGAWTARSVSAVSTTPGNGGAGAARGGGGGGGGASLNGTASGAGGAGGAGYCVVYSW